MDAGEHLFAQIHGRYGTWQNLIKEQWVGICANGIVIGSDHGLSGKLTLPQAAYIQDLRDLPTTEPTARGDLESALYRDFDSRR